MKRQHLGASNLVGAVVLFAFTALLGPLAACDAAGSKPSARITGAKLADLSLDGVTVKFDVKVSNPYPQPMPVERLDYRLSSSGREFIQGESAVAVEAVPSRSSRVIAVPVTLSFAQLLEALEMGKPGSVVPYRAEFGINVSTPPDKDGNEAQRLPMQWDGKFPIPAMPAVELLDVEWADTGLLSAEGLIRLRVTNTNQFDITIKKLAYKLQLQGATLAGGGVDNSKRLAAGATQVIEIPLRLSALKVGAALLEGSRKGGGSYGLSGGLEIGTEFGDLSFPFDRSGKTPV